LSAEISQADQFSSCKPSLNQALLLQVGFF